MSTIFWQKQGRNGEKERIFQLCFQLIKKKNKKKKWQTNSLHCW